MGLARRLCRQKAGSKLKITTELTQKQIQAIAEQHALNTYVSSVLLGAGAVSTVYTLSDELVLRVAAAESARTIYAREAELVPFVRAAGVRTPAILFSGTVPGDGARAYQVLERVDGEQLSAVQMPFSETQQVYRELGEDLARWHIAQVEMPQSLSHFPLDTHPDPRPEINKLVERGYLSNEMTRWLIAWLNRLAPAAEIPLAWRLVHGDARPSNVMVTKGQPRYTALLDWGDAQWADPATEFAFMPLRAVPFALEGYRRVRSDAAAEVTEARVLWYQLSWGVLALGRAPAAEDTWTAPPAGRLLEILRFFGSRPSSNWNDLFPLEA